MVRRFLRRMFRRNDARRFFAPNELRVLAANGLRVEMRWPRRRRGGWWRFVK